VAWWPSGVQALAASAALSIGVNVQRGRDLRRDPSAQAVWQSRPLLRLTPRSELTSKLANDAVSCGVAGKPSPLGESIEESVESVVAGPAHWNQVGVRLVSELVVGSVMHVVSAFLPGALADDAHRVGAG